MVLEILKHLEQLDLVMTFKKVGEQITISVLPKPKTSDQSAQNLAPFIVNGTDHLKLEEQLTRALAGTLPQLSNLTYQMNSYIKSVEEMKEKSAMEQEKKKKEKAKKEKVENALKDFDNLIEEKKYDEAEKAIKSALKVDENNAYAMECQTKLNNAKGSIGLFENAFTAPAPPSQPSTHQMSQDEIEAMIQERYNNRYNSH